MDCETNDCRKEKRGCKGCYYEERKRINDLEKTLQVLDIVNYVQSDNYKI